MAAAPSGVAANSRWHKGDIARSTAPEVAGLEGNLAKTGLESK